MAFQIVALLSAFAFGALIGVIGLAAWWSRMWVRSHPFRVGFLRRIHDDYPADYHHICEMPYEPSGAEMN